MEKREKIILILAGLVLLYGAFDYFILSSDKNETMQSETENKFTGFLESINASLTSLNILEQKKSNPDYFISMIESEWKNDPFSKIKRNQKTTIDKEMAGLMYSGFIKFGNKMLAVIDGMEYTTGENIKDSGYKIIRISSKNVILINKLNKKIVLYLTEG
ncbi:MAG: hypothetical protein DRH26_08865 [Deltaproteobacteria bacterium]|nr:MAG: hypothetical protein DRH26_08865 [Deltaproteobacteria bacterium]